jgi:hypothetical protein
MQKGRKRRETDVNAIFIFSLSFFFERKIDKTFSLAIVLVLRHHDLESNITKNGNII